MTSTISHVRGLTVQPGYENGDANRLFKAFREGVAYGKAEART